MEVWHMNGAGNDFVVLDVRGKKVDLSRLATELCKLTGADGLMAADHSEVSDFRLHFYNSDGSRGEMCGNGARCLCRFAYETGITGEAMTVETDGGAVYGRRLDENIYRIRLPDPGVVDLSRKPGVDYVELGSPGVPHALLEIPDLHWEDRDALRAQAQALRHDPAFPKGANVSMYTLLAPDRAKILTYERYVEDYTLACGTGSAALALVLRRKNLLPGHRLTVQNPGGDLIVTFQTLPNSPDATFLEGPTQIIKVFTAK